MKKNQIKIFLGFSLFFAAIGFLAAPLSVNLWVDNLGNWEWEEYFTDDTFIYQSTTFRDVSYSEYGLIGSGYCHTYTENGEEKGVVYAEVTYTFTSETPIVKAILDISTSSETNFGQSAITKINGENINSQIGHKILDITVYLQNQTQFELKLLFWLVDYTREQDIIVHHIKITGESEIPQEETPNPIVPDQVPPDDVQPEPQKYYYRLSEYIRNKENPSLQRHLARIPHGWLYLIKSLTGVVI